MKAIIEKRLQDQAWASLPDDFKKEVRETAKAYIAISNRGGMSQFEYGALCRLNSLFGRHNLTASECGNLGEDSGNSHKSEDKDLNLCELLKGCEGMEFYSPYLGKCVLDDLDWGDDDHCIRLKNKENGQWVAIPACGHEEGGELMLYPSKDVRTWDGWQKPKRTIKANEWVYYIKLREDDFYISTFVIPSAEVGRHYKLNEFSSRSQAEEAAKRIREVLEKYHDEIGE